MRGLVDPAFTYDSWMMFLGSGRLLGLRRNEAMTIKIFIVQVAVGRSGVAEVFVVLVSDTMDAIHHRPLRVQELIRGSAQGSEILQDYKGMRQQQTSPLQTGWQ
ncbi:MAG: hypothetical protein ACON4K_11250 [Akkermansiaceae bacterium]